MEPLQIIIMLFALFFGSRVILRFKDNKMSLKELVFWLAICAALIITSISPKTLTWLTSYSGSSSKPIDVVIYISIILLFYLVWRLYVLLHGMDQNITILVREIAKNGKNKK